MGMNVSCSLEVGFLVSREDFDRIFCIKPPAKYEMQPRFHPKTGERVEDEGVCIQDADSYYSWQGEQYEYLYEFLDRLAEHYECEIREVGGEYEDRQDIGFCATRRTAKRTRNTDDIDFGRFELNGTTIDLSNWVEIYLELDVIRRHMKECDLDLGDPQAFIAWRIC